MTGKSSTFQTRTPATRSGIPAQDAARDFMKEDARSALVSRGHTDSLRESGYARLSQLSIAGIAGEGLVSTR